MTFYTASFVYTWVAEGDFSTLGERWNIKWKSLFVVGNGQFVDAYKNGGEREPLPFARPSENVFQ